MGVPPPHGSQIAHLLGNNTKPCAFYHFTPVPTERDVINKERASGMYRLSAYYLAKITSELPLMIIFPTIHFNLYYWLSGLNNFIGAYLASWSILIFNTLVGQVRKVPYPGQERDFQWRRQHQNIGGGGPRTFLGGKNVKNMQNCTKIFHFHTEIVKFGLILTHLKLFWGKIGGKNIWGQMPPCPLWCGHC